MATLKEPFALDRSLNTTELTPRNIADVLAEGLSHITGRTASEVEYDNTDSGLTSDDVQGAIDELSERPTLPSVDIQTAVDEFSTYNGGLLSSLKVALSPNQDLHGYAEPWVGGAGKNKLPMTVAGIKSANTSGTWSGNTYTIRGITYTIQTDGAGNVIGILINGTNTSGNNAELNLYTNNSFYLPNGDYILSGGYSNSCRIFYYNGASYYDSRPNPVSFTVDGTETASRCTVIVANGTTLNNAVVYPMIRLATETDPTFAPYFNICPISGHTQVDVDVSDGETTQEQVTVNLGGTYYSGTLDVVSGVFTPDKAKAVTPTRGSLDSSGKLYSISFSGGTIHNYSNTLIATPYVMCSHLDVDSLAGARDTQRKCICQYAGAVYIGGYVGEETALDNMLASADFSIVFELATPTPIQLSPTMVKALVGENHLSAPLDGQEITESEYRELFTWDEVEAYVNAHSGGGGGGGVDYSTTEVDTGIKWTNGKPIYMHTFTNVGLPQNAYRATLDLGVEADTIVKIEANDSANAGNATIIFEGVYAKINKTAGNNTILNPTNQLANLTGATLTVYYTKATD